METKRLSKIERLLQKELSEIFRRQTQATRGMIISVSVVRVSADLSVAKAYLSIFPSEKGEEVLESIRANVKSVRYELGQRVRLQLRKIPDLSFFIDDSLDYIENIDSLLNTQLPAGGHEGSDSK
ncbi:MAG: 30S ribosome-binding factor RbfA [Tannerellaceae bacterium]|jgi:ribosome-binding factor A|nr:30S ribosome-binding factor RbfA [Tannerellaceae bacterium]